MKHLIVKDLKPIQSLKNNETVAKDDLLVGGIFPLWDIYYSLDGSVNLRKGGWKKVDSGFASCLPHMQQWVHVVVQNLFVNKYIIGNRKHARITRIEALDSSDRDFIIFAPEDVWGFDMQRYVEPRDVQKDSKQLWSILPEPKRSQTSTPASSITGIRWTHVHKHEYSFEKPIPESFMKYLPFEVQAWCEMFAFMKQHDSIMGPPDMTKCPPGDPKCSKAMNKYIKTCVEGYKNMIRAYIGEDEAVDEKKVQLMPYTDDEITEAYTRFLKEFQVRFEKDMVAVTQNRRGPLTTEDLVKDALYQHAYMAQFREKATIMSLGASIWALLHRSLRPQPDKRSPGVWFWGYSGEGGHHFVPDKSKREKTILAFLETNPFMKHYVKKMLHPNPYERISLMDLMYQLGRMGNNSLDVYTKYNKVQDSIGSTTRNPLPDRYDDDNSKPGFRSIL